MTENEAKLGKAIAEDYKAVLHEAKSMGCNNIRALYNIPLKNMELIVKALEEVQQYRTLEKRLSDMFCSSVSLKSVVDELERNLKEPDSPHPMKARILTYKESADWDAYRAIGTPEECRKAMEKQTAVPRELIEGKYFCPKCHNLMPYPGYCGCGQRLY